MIEIGPYHKHAGFDQAFNIVDDYHMVIGNAPPDYGRGDSIGRNFKTYFTYDDPELVKANSELWYVNTYGEYVGNRHPELTPSGHPMSRDHYLYTLLSLKLYELRNNDKRYRGKIREIHEGTGCMISSKARKMFSIKLWSEALLDNRLAEFFYYVVEILTVSFIYLPIHKLGSLIANYDDEVYQGDWIPYPQKERLQDLPKYKQIISKIIYPSYALILSGWQLYVLRKSFGKKLLSWLYRPMIGKTNYVQQMLFGMKVCRYDVKFYEPMRGGRWTGYLSNRNDRDMRLLLPKPEFNNIDSDMVKKLYNETQL